jgi:hypothetical protein
MFFITETYHGMITAPSNAYLYNIVCAGVEPCSHEARSLKFPDKLPPNLPTEHARTAEKLWILLGSWHIIGIAIRSDAISPETRFMDQSFRTNDKVS